MSQNRHKNASSFTLALSLCGLSGFISMAIGSADISLPELWQTFKQLSRGLALTDAEHLSWTILFDLRLPRLLAAALCGAALAIAGTISQGLFRNSLASPSVLGIESGAALAAVLAFYTGQAFLHWLSLPLAAFAGASVATTLIAYLALRRGGLPLDSLLLIGLALNSLFGAATSLGLSLLVDDLQKTGAVMHWLLGGFSAKGWEHIAVGTPLILIAAAASYRLAPALDALALGEDIATSLSVELHALRRRSIIYLALLVGTSVSIGGAIPFVGLIIPHLSRSLIGPQHKRLFLFAAINGASLLMLADLLGRTLQAPRELEVGIVTSLLGAPFFLYLLLKRKPQL